MVRVINQRYPATGMMQPATIGARLIWIGLFRICNVLESEHQYLEVAEKITVYAIKGSDNPADVAMVYKSLLEAEGLFGWSYVETADLRQLRDRIELNGWESLSEGEKECYQEFLLRLREDDYIVYVNVPEWGECTLARVAGSYVWRWEHEDFNHRFPVDPDSVQSFDRNSEVVPAALSARLKLPGRWWQVYAEAEFKNC